MRLHQERLDAERDLVDVRLRLGHGEDLVAGLATRAVEWPLDVPAGRYVPALHRAGRTADALAHYRQVRARLVDELGTDPGAALQDLHRRILAADTSLAAPVASLPPAGTAVEPVVVPRRLPAAPPSFVGRRAELDRLDANAGTPATVVTSAIAGAGGIGKTWLAPHWAHRHAGEFPDGQLFVDLQGFSPDSAPMDPAVAVRGFSTPWASSPTASPVDPHAQAALFRGLVADKRVLDKASTPPSPAADAGQPVVRGGHDQPQPPVRPGHGARRAPRAAGRAVRRRGARAAARPARPGPRRGGPGVGPGADRVVRRFPSGPSPCAATSATPRRPPTPWNGSATREPRSAGTTTPARRGGKRQPQGRDAEARRVQRQLDAVDAATTDNRW